MKFKMIALAVAAAAAAPAFAAVTPAQLQTAYNAGRYINMSGASATQATVKEAFTAACADAVQTFTADGKNIYAYGCTIKAGKGYPAAWVGQPAVLFHTVSGGSLQSILGMSTDAAQQVDFVKTDFAGCTASGTDNFVGCATEKRRSNGGFSDVEKALFIDVLGATPPVGVNLNQIVVTQALAGQTFGVAASLPLFYALQSVQGISCPAGDFSPACTPSISRTEYATLVARGNAGSIGSFYGWDVLDLGSAGNGTSGPGANESVIICRRPVTSGTQASSNAFFLKKNCAVGGLEPAAPGDSNGSYTVIENSSTGNAKTCLGDGATAAAGSQFRIGIISAENAPKASDNWQWLKLDGAALHGDAGQRANTIEMDYQFAMEMVLHTSSDTSITPAAQAVAMQALTTELGNTANPKTGIYVVPHGSVYYTAPGGVIGRATNGGDSCSPMREFL